MLWAQGSSCAQASRPFKEVKEDHDVLRRLSRDTFSLRETFQGLPVLNHLRIPQLPAEFVIVRQLSNGAEWAAGAVQGILGTGPVVQVIGPVIQSRHDLDSDVRGSNAASDFLRRESRKLEAVFPECHSVGP